MLAVAEAQGAAGFELGEAVVALARGVGFPVITQASMPSHHWSRGLGEGDQFGQVRAVYAETLEAVASGGDRGMVGEDVGVLGGETEQIAQEFLGLPTLIDLPPTGSHLRQLGF
ncbi:hypothetical protein ACFYY1_26450 [Streptomyces sp. NPDC001890]|uniref:hypothetical protein n=1 Tax=Streptomyces sp. NPDC001890 TaxID=3364620 RepID=UPI0036B3D1AC